MVVHVDPSYCIQVLIINDKLPPNGQNDPWSCNAWAITNSLSIQLCTPGNQTWQWEILQKKALMGKSAINWWIFHCHVWKKLNTRGWLQKLDPDEVSWCTVLCFRNLRSASLLMIPHGKLHLAACSILLYVVGGWYITQLSFKNDQQVIPFPNLPLIISPLFS